MGVGGGQVLPIEDMDVRKDEERRGWTTHDLIHVPLDLEDPKKVTYIGAFLQGPIEGKIDKVLTRK